MAGLKVVALISGGKDSFFSILHCQANGHEVVALANLHPPAQDGPTTEDMDSYMYQTIGHAVIPLYEHALGLPLYRQAIAGAAINQDKSYGVRPPYLETVDNAADETESLVPLLRQVMAAHPEVNAVSTGAILSDYQRTRVESVALRLGLVPLSYLWQFPYLPPYSETSLLDDMTAVGQDARIIKVASGGLDDSFLWENVALGRTKFRLVRAMERFGVAGGGAALGEGGEYETLAIDGPLPLWKGRIEIADGQRNIVNGDAGTAALRIHNAAVVPKDAQVSIDRPQSALRIPPLLDDKFAALQMDLKTSVDRQTQGHGHDIGRALLPGSSVLTKPLICHRLDTKDAIMISNVTSHGAEAGTQMTKIMTKILDDEGLAPEAIISTTILLRSMEDFGSVNVAYGCAFTAANPPARVTISCGNMLPPGVLVSLSAIAIRSNITAKRGLHVQSRSYWAPANIGPYSQAIAVLLQLPGQDDTSARMVHVAGQIPLLPASMELPKSSDTQPNVRLQTVLSLQHLFRIGQVMGVQTWLGAIAFLSAAEDMSDTYPVAAALEAWTLAHAQAEVVSDEEENDVDVWDIAHGQHSSRHATPGGGISSARRPALQTDFVPPCFVAEVEALPRGASIEWSSTGFDCVAGARMEHADNNMPGVSCQRIIVESDAGKTVVAAWAALQDLQTLEGWRAVESVVSDAVQTMVCTVYASVPIPADWIEAHKAHVIPCRRLWDARSNSQAAVVTWKLC